MISQFDPRHVIHGRAIQSADLRNLHAELSRTTDTESQLKIYRKIQEVEAREALSVLERNVREYIAWARSQGLQ